MIKIISQPGSFCYHNKIIHMPFYHDQGKALGVSTTNATDCCNKHDICWSTCGSKKKECDTEFFKCLIKICGAGDSLLEDASKALRFLGKKKILPNRLQMVKCTFLNRQST